MLQMQSVPDPVVHLPDLSLEELPLVEHTVKFDLTLYVSEREGAIDVAYEYDAALFEAATIERLAARLSRLLDAIAAAPEARIDELGLPEPLPPAAREIVAMPQTEARRGLSPHQQRLWSIDVSEAGTVCEGAPTYHNLPLLLEFDGTVLPDHLEAALNLVVARHDALRTRIASDGSVAWQSVDPHASLPLAQIDLGDGQTLLERALAEVERPFRLDQDRLIRAAVLREGGDRAWLCLVVHHIVADRRSLQLLAQELITAYAAIAQGQAPALPALPLSFGDHVHWQSTLGKEALEPLLLYWKQQLHGRLQAMELPSTRPRPALPTFTAGRHSLAIDAGLGERLKVFAQDHAVAIEDVLLAGFKALLRRYTGHDELVVGTRVDGRDPSGLQAVMDARGIGFPDLAEGRGAHPQARRTAWRHAVRSVGGRTRSRPGYESCGAVRRRVPVRRACRTGRPKRRHRGAAGGDQPRLRQIRPAPVRVSARRWLPDTAGLQRRSV
jgi:hypothetical protein